MTYDTFTGILGVDIETSSAADIKKVSAWAYSQHPSTIVLCIVFCYSTGRDDVKRYDVWEPGDVVPTEIIDFLCAGGRMLAHNRSFEIAIWKNILEALGFSRVNDDQWLDTQPLGQAINLPSSLDGLARALGCPMQKDVEGKKVMLQMCKAKPDGDGDWIYPFRDDVGKRFDLSQYCQTDVGTMLDCYWRLPKLSVTEALVLDADHKINCRGMFLNQSFARQCAVMANKRKAELDDETFDITAGELANSRAAPALKTWLKEHGVKLPTKITRKKQKDGTFKASRSETADKVDMNTAR